MLERLIVKNFLCLKDIDIEVKDFLILIGPQAAGKSLCAKLLYFFRSVMDNIHIHLFETGEKKLIDYQQHAIEKFELFFDKTQWGDCAFEINYSFEYSIKILKKKKKNIKILFSQDLSEHYQYVEKMINTREKDDDGTNKESLSFLYGTNYVDTAEKLYSFLREIFIPAGRSFFSLLEQNIFAFLSISSNIDSFMKNFGVFLESIRRKKNVLPQEAASLMNTILKGDYIPEEEVLMQPDGRKVSLHISSSGQQEALPLAIILSYLISTPSKYKHSNLYVEEPEAHLFPNAQEAMTRLISYAQHNSKLRLTPVTHIQELLEVGFVITTHSPYMLTAFNNLILAGNIVKQNPECKEAVCKIIPESMHIDIDCFSAYSLADGKAVSIINRENNLIDAETIDGVSESIGETFSKLLAIEFESKDSQNV